jgi:hypothetical protein
MWMEKFGDDIVVESVRPSVKVGVTYDIRDARMANATMTPIRSVPTPDMTRLRLRHQVAFWKDLSSAGPMAWANCCSKSAWLTVGVPTVLGSRGKGRNEAIIQAVVLISKSLHT